MDEVNRKVESSDDSQEVSIGGAAADKTPEVHNAEGVLGSLEALKSLARYERRALTRWFRCLDDMQIAMVEKGTQL